MNVPDEDQTRLAAGRIAALTDQQAAFLSSRFERLLNRAPDDNRDELALSIASSLAASGVLAHVPGPREARDLSRYTTPHPIGDLHEDHGEVIAARWRDGSLEEWACTSLLTADFDAENWTHFYRFPPVQPPTP